jgi:dCMP deaminase
MNRPDKIAVFMKMALAMAELATCPKRKVACILLDKDYRIIGSGYNGMPRGVDHCTGENCSCTHAEINALDNCLEESSIKHIVTTCLPCGDCANKLLRTCRRPTIWYYETSKNSINPATHGQLMKPQDLTVQKWSAVPGFVPWRAKKVGGSYQAEGYVVSEFETLAGAKRYVFEFDLMTGVLHIFNDSQVVEFGVDS